jgi:hypothetical protein
LVLLKKLNRKLHKPKDSHLIQPAVQLSAIVRHYIADILNTPGETMTSEEAVLKLNAGGAFPQTIEALSAILESLEHSQFSLVSAQPEQLQENIRKLLQILPAIDRQIKRQGDKSLKKMGA